MRKRNVDTASRLPQLTGLELRERRERAGLTQGQIALAAGWAHRAVVSDIERMAFVPHGTATKYLTALADAASDAAPLSPSPA